MQSPWMNDENGSRIRFETSESHPSIFSFTSTDAEGVESEMTIAPRRPHLRAANGAARRNARRLSAASGTTVAWSTYQFVSKKWKLAADSDGSVKAAEAAEAVEVEEVEEA